jgi:hypothetical protein
MKNDGGKCMSVFTQEISSDRARIRFDVVGGPERSRIVEDDTFLNYRLGSVNISYGATKPKANLIWYEIFDIVKQNTTTAFISTPQDDMMERLLRKKKERD